MEFFSPTEEKSNCFNPNWRWLNISSVFKGVFNTMNLVEK